MARKKASAPAEFLKAPKGISKRGGEIWRDVVQSFPLDYFVDAHRPMILSYCEASAMAEKLRNRSLRITNEEHLSTLLRMIESQERQALASARSLRITLQSQAPPQNPSGKARQQNPDASGDEPADTWPSLFPDDALPN